MSKFSGAQGRGAMRGYRKTKRHEAEDRQWAAVLAAHPNGKCDCPKRSNEPSRHTTQGLS